MKKYAFRRAIISALFKYENPQSFSTVLLNRALLLAAGHLSLTGEDIQDIRTQWRFLIDRGYLVPVPGYDDYVKLSGELRSILDAQDPLSGVNPLAGNEHLYGPDALR